MFSLFDKDALESFRKEHAIDPYRIKQIFVEVFKNATIDFSEMTALPKSLRDLFVEHVYIIPFVEVACTEDDEVVKFLFAHK